MKIGNRTLTVEETAAFLKKCAERTKEEMGADCVLFVEKIYDLEAEATLLEEELELTNEICDDLRTEVEQKDNTIRSLVEGTTLLARKLPA